MSVSLKRKLYPRGGSYETTIPLQLLLGLDLGGRNDAIFEYDSKTGRWYVRFEKSKDDSKTNSKIENSKTKNPQNKVAKRSKK